MQKLYNRYIEIKVFKKKRNNNKEEKFEQKENQNF